MKKMLLSAVALTAMVAFGGNAWADLLIGVAGRSPDRTPLSALSSRRALNRRLPTSMRPAASMASRSRSCSATTSPTRSRVFPSPNKFVGDGVKFVIGHFNSGVSIPASEVYAENGIFQITPASTNPNFTERGLWNTFRTCGRDDQQGAVAGKYIADHFKDAKVAVVHDKTPYGQGLADETKKAMNGLASPKLSTKASRPAKRTTRPSSPR